MADANPNTPAPDENQPQLPLENQEPLITSDPEAAKTMKAAETQRAEVKEALKSVTPEVAEKAIETIKADAPVSELKPVEPVSKEEQAIYREAHEGASEKTYEERSEEGLKAVEEHRRQMKAKPLPKQAAKVIPSPEAGKISAELSKLSEEKISAWLDKNKDNIKKGLVKIFTIDPKFAMSDEELARFIYELKDPAAIEHKTFFALSDWLTRVQKAGQPVNISDQVGIDVILSQIERDEILGEISEQ